MSARVLALDAGQTGSRALGSDEPERVSERPRAASDQAVSAKNLCTEVKKGNPSRVPPVKASTLCSGCGIKPTTLPRSLVMPAISLRDPFGLSR